MESIADLEELLQSQFGPFIRDSRYSIAFKKAMKSIEKLPQTPAKIDAFYLFLHHLVLELFGEIDRLTSLLQSR